MEQTQLEEMQENLFSTEKEKLVLQVVFSVEQELASDGNLHMSFFLSAWSHLGA